MSKKEITDDELDAELDRAFKANETKKDNCGTPMPANKEVGVQRTGAKLKKD